MDLFEAIKCWFRRGKRSEDSVAPTEKREEKVVVSKPSSPAKSEKPRNTRLKPSKTVKLESDPFNEQFRKSPNQSSRGGVTPKYIVLHDSCGSHDGTKSWILQSRSKVSYHYLIDDDGNRTQFVGDTKKAWHAGRSSWDGIVGLNSHSLGIAFYGDTHQRLPSDTEINSAAWKCIYLMDKFDIPVSNIITHQMISPKRKTDTSPKTHARVLRRIKTLID